MNILKSSMNFNNNVILGLITLLIMTCCKSTMDTDVNSYDFSYQNKWHYFKLEDTISVKVVDHLAAEALCGYCATASITIATTTEGDTIRIINLCNMDKYKTSDIVRFIPADKPQFKVSLPYSTIYNPREHQLEPGFYDKHISATTYGFAIRNNQ